MEKNTDITRPPYSKHIFSVPCPFIIIIEVPLYKKIGLVYVVIIMIIIIIIIIIIMVYLTDPWGGSSPLNYIKNKLTYIVYAFLWHNSLTNASSCDNFLRAP